VRPLTPVPESACREVQGSSSSTSKVADDSVSLVLLAGGVGKRMGVSFNMHNTELAESTHGHVVCSGFTVAAKTHCASGWHYMHAMMQAAIPKQYLELLGQPIATYSMQTFARMHQIKEVVVVCEPEWR